MEERKLEVYTFKIHQNRKTDVFPLLENIQGVDLHTELVNNFPCWRERLARDFFLY